MVDWWTICNAFKTMAGCTLLLVINSAFATPRAVLYEDQMQGFLPRMQSVIADVRRGYANQAVEEGRSAPATMITCQCTPIARPHACLTSACQRHRVKSMQKVCDAYAPPGTHILLQGLSHEKLRVRRARTPCSGGMHLHGASVSTENGSRCPCDSTQERRARRKAGYRRSWCRQGPERLQDFRQGTE